MATTAVLLKLKSFFRTLAFLGASAAMVFLLCNCVRAETEDIYAKNLDHAFYRPTTNVQYPVNYLGSVVQIILDDVTLGAAVQPSVGGVWLNICLTVPKKSTIRANWNNLKVNVVEGFPGENKTIHIARRQLMRLNLNQPVYAYLFPPIGRRGKPTILFLNKAFFTWGKFPASFTLLNWPREKVTLVHSTGKKPSVYHLGFFLTPPPKRVAIRIPDMIVNGRDIHSFLITFTWRPRYPFYALGNVKKAAGEMASVAKYRISLRPRSVHLPHGAN